MTDRLISNATPESAQNTDTRSQRVSSLAQYWSEQVNQVALLAMLIGIIALFYPFVTLYVSRVMPLGEEFKLWQLNRQIHDISYWTIAVVLSWLGVLITACVPQGRFKNVGLTLSIIITSLVLISASSYGTQTLVNTDLARVSLSTGAWLSGFAIYVLLFSIYQQHHKLIFLPVVVLLIWIGFAPFEHWGVYREYIAAPDAFKKELYQHISLVLSVLPIIIFVGTALGFVATQQAWLEEIILSLNGFMQTVPSIALYGLLLPILSIYGKSLTLGQSLVVLIGILIGLGVLASIIRISKKNQIKRVLNIILYLLGFIGVLLFLPILTNTLFQLYTDAPTWIANLSFSKSWDELGVRGLGTTPALIALVLYGVFPLIVNVHSSIQNISTDLIEAAKGIGLSRAQIFWKVQLPLILPFFIDGIRLSCLMLISLATIAVLVNAGGLGVLLMRGTEQSVQDLILLGCVPAVVLALLIDAGLRFIQILITPQGLRK